MNEKGLQRAWPNQMNTYDMQRTKKVRVIMLASREVERGVGILLGFLESPRNNLSA